MNYQQNPMLNQLKGISQNQSLPQQNNIMAMFNYVKNSSNPQQALFNILKNNPNFQNVLQYIKNNGNDPKQAFFKMAQEKGINPEEILKNFVK